ncbi:MAG: tetratricopeptide repeat protein [Candidatus Woykebacteria bacterium]
MVSQISIDPLVDEAIDAALENNWQKALQLNQELLKKYPEDVDTLNRLARSLAETGKVAESKKLYRKVLELDPYNSIAAKNLAKLSSIRKTEVNEGQIFSSLKGDLFLEESGKTCTSILEDTAMTSILVALRTGDKTQLSPQKSNLVVLSSGGRRLGKIPGGLAKRMMQDIKIGSKFEGIIKSVYIKSEKSENPKPQVAIFLREVYRSKKVSSSPFPTTNSPFTPYVREETLNLLSSQAPLPTEADDDIEEVEVSTLLSSNQDQSLESLAEKEREADDDLEE